MMTNMEQVKESLIYKNMILGMITNLHKSERVKKLQTFSLDLTISNKILYRLADMFAELPAGNRNASQFAKLLKCEVYGYDPHTGNLGLSINEFAMDHKGDIVSSLISPIVLVYNKDEDLSKAFVISILGTDGPGFISAESEGVAFEQLGQLLNNAPYKHKIQNTGKRVKGNT